MSSLSFTPFKQTSQSSQDETTPPPQRRRIASSPLVGSLQKAPLSLSFLQFLTANTPSQDSCQATPLRERNFLFSPHAPDDDFSDSFFFSSPFSPRSRPLSKFVNDISENPPAPSPLEKIHHIHENQIISRQENTFQICSIDDAQGTYYQLYGFMPDLNEFIPGRPNESILIKMLLRNLCRPDNQSLRAKEARVHFLKKWLPNACRQYKMLRDNTKLPVVTVYNIETAVSDGYFVVEKVTPLKNRGLFEFWDSEKVSEKGKEMIDQIKPYFDHALREETDFPLDITAENFGFREDGTIVLLDFSREEPISDETFYRPAFSIDAKRALRNFGNPEIFAYLCSSIAGKPLHTHLMESNPYKDTPNGPWSWEIRHTKSD